MAKLRTYIASDPSTREVCEAFDEQIAASADPSVRMLFAFFDQEHDAALLHAYVKAKFPNAAVLGGTSMGGLFTKQGLHGRDTVGLLCVEDPSGHFGAACGALGADPASSAQALLLQALRNAGCPGELPELVWVFQAPGREEQVLEGLRRVVGDCCPVVGGSSGDEALAGRWKQLGPSGPLQDGLVVGVMFPSVPVGVAFQSGYEPTGHSGVVTQLADVAPGEGAPGASPQGRMVARIDHEPAALTYNRWTQGRLDARLAQGGNILDDTCLHPVATEVGHIDGVAQYRLVQPGSIDPDGVLQTFCAVQQGQRLFAMRGDRGRLIDRAGRVAQQACKSLPIERSVAGGLLLVCGGCKMGMGDGLSEVPDMVAKALGDAPFIGAFTLGEQGPLLGRNVHANLMVSALAFGG